MKWIVDEVGGMKDEGEGLMCGCQRGKEDKEVGKVSR